jgi:hypothetical protein
MSTSARVLRRVAPLEFSPAFQCRESDPRQQRCSRIATFAFLRHYVTRRNFAALRLQGLNPPAKLNRRYASKAVLVAAAPGAISTSAGEVAALAPLKQIHEREGRRAYTKSVIQSFNCQAAHVKTKTKCADGR